jgi:hypothetical protein
MKERIQKREEDMLAGRIGRVIKSVMGTRKDLVRLEELRIRGRMITDSGDIHRQVTDFFKEWFTSKTYMRGGAMGDSVGDWRSIRCTLEEFKDKCAPQGVPSHLVEAIWEALMVQPSQEERDWGDTLLTPVTLEEFNRAIDSTKTNSAGGMSGLTYNMMRCWSVATRRRVYDMLVSCWEEGVIPDYWKWRWLVPIPKKEDSFVGFMRLQNSPKNARSVKTRKPTGDQNRHTGKQTGKFFPLWGNLNQGNWFEIAKVTNFLQRSAEKSGGRSGFSISQDYVNKTKDTNRQISIG